MYVECKPNQREDFEGSPYGYIIEPDGTILSLTDLQTHGRIAYERYEAVREYYDALDEDRKNRCKTAAEVYATEELGHVRISIAPYVYSWSIGTSYNLPLTNAQCEALEFLLDVVGPDDEDEIWDNSGPLTVGQFRRVIR